MLWKKQAPEKSKNVGNESDVKVTFSLGAKSPLLAWHKIQCHCKSPHTCPPWGVGECNSVLMTRQFFLGGIYVKIHDPYRTLCLSRVALLFKIRLRLETTFTRLLAFWEYQIPRESKAVHGHQPPAKIQNCFHFWMTIALLLQSTIWAINKCNLGVFF